MPSRIVVPFLASLALCASAALAQQAPPPAAGGPGPHMNWSQADMEKHHAQMCQNLYAHAVGRLAELEASLSLTDVQKPLFERWKAVRLAGAKSHQAQCTNSQFPGRDASIMDKLKLEQTMLETRLAELKAETPSLQAVVASLDADQQRMLERAAMRAHHERMGMMERMHHHMHAHDWMGHFDHGDQPPPAEQ